MEKEYKCAAVVQLGWMTHYLEGDDFFDILNKMSEYQDFSCLCNHARMMGSSEDALVADRIEDWLYNFNGNPGDMHRFDAMDFNLSIGEIKCLGWAQGKENCEALRKRFPNI